jgi:hypothetical protein
VRRELLAAVVLAGALLLLALPASAQQPVVTSPSRVASVNASGTIAVTNTFQQIFASALLLAQPRQGCLIQNGGASTMWVFFGPIASATKAASFQLVPPGVGVQGGAIGCATGGGGVLQDQVSITGTATEAFTAARQ